MIDLDDDIYQASKIAHYDLSDSPIFNYKNFLAHSGLIELEFSFHGKFINVGRLRFDSMVKEAPADATRYIGKTPRTTHKQGHMIKTTLVYSQEENKRFSAKPKSET